MKKTWWTVLFLVLAGTAMADENTEALAAQLANYSPGQLLHFLEVVATGALVAPFGQAFLEHLFACMPKLPALVKSTGPVLLGMAGAYAANRYLGIDQKTAQVGWASFVGFTHLFNQSSMAVVSGPAPALANPGPAAK